MRIRKKCIYATNSFINGYNHQNPFLNKAESRNTSMEESFTSFDDRINLMNSNKVIKPTLMFEHKRKLKEIAENIKRLKEIDLRDHLKLPCAINFRTISIKNSNPTKIIADCDVIENNENSINSFYDFDTPLKYKQKSFNKSNQLLYKLKKREFNLPLINISKMNPKNNPYEALNLQKQSNVQVKRSRAESCENTSSTDLIDNITNEFTDCNEEVPKKVKKKIVFQRIHRIKQEII